MKNILNIIKLARLENALLPMLAVTAGFMQAQSSNYHQLAVCLIVLVLLHSVITIWNDIADEASDQHNGIVRITELKQAGGYRQLLISLRVTLIAVSVLSVFLPTSSRLVIAGSVVLAWAYNSRPIQASRRPLISIIVLGLSYGLLPFMLGASLGKLSWPVVYLAIGWTVGRTSLSLLKDYKDAAGDAVASKRTFLLVHGNWLTARLSLGLAGLGYLLCLAVVAITNSPWRLILALSIIAVWLIYARAQLLTARSYRDLNRVFHDCLRYQLLFDGLVVACLHTC